MVRLTGWLMGSAVPADGAGLRRAFTASAPKSGWSSSVRPRRSRLVVDRRTMQGMDDGPWTALGAFGWFLGPGSS